MSKKLRTALWLTVAANLGLYAVLGAAAVQAAVPSLVTAPLFVIADESVACEIVNVSDTTRTVLIETLDSQATIVATTQITLLAGQSTQLDYTVEVTDRYICRFTQVPGSIISMQENFRAVINRFVGSSSDLNGFPAQ